MVEGRKRKEERRKCKRKRARGKEEGKKLRLRFKMFSSLGFPPIGFHSGFYSALF